MSDQSPEWLEFTISDGAWNPLKEARAIVADMRSVVREYGTRPLQLREIRRISHAFKITILTPEFESDFPGFVAPMTGHIYVSMNSTLRGHARRFFLLHELSHAIGGHLDEQIWAGVNGRNTTPRSHLRYRQEDLVCDAISYLGVCGPAIRPEWIAKQIGCLWGTEPEGVAERDFRIREGSRIAQQLARSLPRPRKTCPTVSPRWQWRHRCLDETYRSFRRALDRHCSTTSPAN